MKKRKGFTLIEIIISITLIALIASYGLFKYSEVQEQAKQKLDLAAVGTFVEAVELLRMEDKEYAKKNEIKSSDTKIQNYVSGTLEGKSKLYDGFFIANYDSNGKLTVTNQNKTYRLYPTVESISASAGE